MLSRNLEQKEGRRLLEDESIFYSNWRIVHVGIYKTIFSSPAFFSQRIFSKTIQLMRTSVVPTIIFIISYTNRSTMTGQNSDVYEGNLTPPPILRGSHYH